MREAYDRRIIKFRRFGWMLLVALTLAGCTLPQDQSPPPQTYLLEGSTHAMPPSRRSSNKTLLVTTPRAAPGFDSNRIAYTKEPPKLDYYNDSLWSDTPAKMLLPILVRVFESTGAFKAVLSPPAPALANLRVDVDVIRLQQEFMIRPSRVRFTARVKIVDMKSSHVLATQVFETIESAPSEDASGAARAANAAIQQALDQMVSFALRYLS